MSKSDKPVSGVPKLQKPKVNERRLEQILDVELLELTSSLSHLVMDDSVIDFIVDQLVAKIDAAIDYGNTPIGRAIDSVDHIILRAIIRVLVVKRVKK